MGEEPGGAQLTPGTMPSMRAGLAAVTVTGVIAVGVCAYAYGGSSLRRAWRSLKRAWRGLRVRTLGGVTTLERQLSYNCTICMRSMDALEVVRTLSCNHVFHCGGSDKCKDHIDKWLRDQPTMSCPLCRRTPRPVLPWKAPPPEAAPAPAPVPEPSADQEQPESSDQEQQESSEESVLQL